MHPTTELYKIIIALVVIIVGSWGLFGWVVKRWINSTDTDIKELEQATSKNNITIAEIETRCKERDRNGKS